jgi:hypothetical protein
MDTDMDTDRDTVANRDTDTDRETDIDIDNNTDRDTYRDTDPDRDTDTDRGTYTNRDMDTDRVIIIDQYGLLEPALDPWCISLDTPFQLVCSHSAFCFLPLLIENISIKKFREIFVEFFVRCLQILQKCLNRTVSRYIFFLVLKF